MKKYTKEEFLKAAEIGEVSMIDAKHIVSLLDEARHILKVGFDCHKGTEINNERSLMTSNINKEKCPKCGAVEIDAMTPRTVYLCGSSDYDQRLNTFSQSEECKQNEKIY
jgi:hypothetical protein